MSERRPITLNEIAPGRPRHLIDPHRDHPEAGARPAPAPQRGRGLADLLFVRGSRLGLADRCIRGAMDRRPSHDPPHPGSKFHIRVGKASIDERSTPRLVAILSGLKRRPLLLQLLVPREISIDFAPAKAHFRDDKSRLP